MGENFAEPLVVVLELVLRLEGWKTGDGYNAIVVLLKNGNGQRRNSVNLNLASFEALLMIKAD